MRPSATTSPQRHGPGTAAGAAVGPGPAVHRQDPPTARTPRPRLRLPRLRPAPAWTQAHHIVAWSRGGPTTVDNGVLLCGHHHRLIHQGHWTVTIADDGQPEFTPPDWIDPHRNHSATTHSAPEPAPGPHLTVPDLRAVLVEEDGFEVRPESPIRRVNSSLSGPTRVDHQLGRSAPERASQRQPGRRDARWEVSQAASESSSSTSPRARNMSNGATPVRS